MRSKPDREARHRIIRYAYGRCGVRTNRGRRHREQLLRHVPEEANRTDTNHSPSGRFGRCQYGRHSRIAAISSELRWAVSYAKMLADMRLYDERENCSESRHHHEMNQARRSHKRFIEAKSEICISAFAFLSLATPS